MIVNLELLGERSEWDGVEIQDRNFHDQHVVVDNHQFARCSFVKCVLVYSGGPCGFLDCEVDIESAASLTGAAYRGHRLWQKLDERPSLVPGG